MIRFYAGVFRGWEKMSHLFMKLPIAKDITEEELRRVEQERREKEKRIMF